MSCRSCSRSFWSICMLFVKRRGQVLSGKWQGDWGFLSPRLVPSPCWLQLLVLQHFSSEPDQVPHPVENSQQPLFLLSGWVESAYGDVLGGSGQGILSRAVCSPNCTQKELFFFQNAQHVQSKQVPCVCTFRWLWVTNLESAVIFLWNHTCLQAVAVRTLLRFTVCVCSC